MACPPRRALSGVGKLVSGDAERADLTLRFIFPASAEDEPFLNTKASPAKDRQEAIKKAFQEEMDQMSNNAIPFTKNPDLGPKSKQPLSNREQEIVNLVIQGYRNSDIAEMLSTSELTVNGDLSGIFDKLAISDRLELLLSTMHDRLMGQS